MYLMNYVNRKIVTTEGC